MDMSGAPSSSEDESPMPYVEILEQPKSRGYRFRYGCEGKTAGCLPGEGSHSNKKTTPSFKVHNVPQGCTTIVVVSCVTEDESHRPHPHKLVGKDCEKGVCTITLKRTSTVLLQHVGIQCVKKKDIQLSLEQREQIKVNPFSGPFYEKEFTYDLKKVQLAIQAFIQDKRSGQHIPLPTVLTQTIHDLKGENDLVICRTDRSSSQAKGGEEVFLLCDKVNKDDIQVQFLDHTGWEAWGDFSPADVHKQFAIVFKTPPYKNNDLREPVAAQMRLFRPSDEAFSEYKTFIYKPNEIDPYRVSGKKRKIGKLNLPGPEPQMPMLSAFSNGKKMPTFEMLQKIYKIRGPGSSVSAQMNPTAQTVQQVTRKPSATQSRAPDSSPMAVEGFPTVFVNQQQSESINAASFFTSAPIESIPQHVPSNSPASFSVQSPKMEPPSPHNIPSCLGDLVSSAPQTVTITTQNISNAPLPTMLDDFAANPNTSKSITHHVPVSSVLPESVQGVLLSQAVMATEDSDPHQLFANMTSDFDIPELGIGTYDWANNQILTFNDDDELTSYLANNPSVLEPDGGGGVVDEGGGGKRGASRQRKRQKEKSHRKRNSSNNNRKGT